MRTPPQSHRRLTLRLATAGLSATLLAGAARPAAGAKPAATAKPTPAKPATPAAKPDAGKPAAPKPGVIDDEVLKIVADATRQAKLAACMKEADVHLSFEQQAGREWSVDEVFNLESRLALGTLKRDEFLKQAPAILKEKRDKLAKLLGPEKLAKAQEATKRPQRQAEVY